MGVEQWYFTDPAGPACGPGDRETLEQDGGSTGTTKVLDATGDTWNALQSRTIPAGDWKVSFRVDVSAGIGDPIVRVLVRRLTSGCSVQQAMILEDITVSGGENTYETAPVDPGDVVFRAGEMLTVQLFQVGGSQTITLKYNASSGVDRCYVEFPDQETRRLEFLAPTGPPPIQPRRVVAY